MPKENARVAVEPRPYIIETQPKNQLSFRRKLVIFPSITGKREHDIIIDYNFKEFFSLPNASDAYRMVLHRIPTIFHGTREQLRSILKSMSIELAHELRRSGMDLIPPWRSFQGMCSSYGVMAVEDEGQIAACFADVVVQRPRKVRMVGLSEPPPSVSDYTDIFGFGVLKSFE